MFHAKAAYSDRSKIVTLAEELRRRLRNTDRAHKKEDLVVILEKFIGKMANSGYNVSSRREVIKSGVTKYYRELRDWRTGGKSLYRTQDQMGRDRRYKGLEKMTWFRSKRGGRQVTTEKDNPWLARQRRDQEDTTGDRCGPPGKARVGGRRTGKRAERESGEEDRLGGGEGNLDREARRQLVVEAVAFIPYTPRSALKKELQKVDDTIAESLGRPKIRFVERGGGQIV